MEVYRRNCYLVVTVDGHQLSKHFCNNSIANGKAHYQILLDRGDEVHVLAIEDFCTGAKIEERTYIPRSHVVQFIKDVHNIGDCKSVDLKVDKDGDCLYLRFSLKNGDDPRVSNKRYPPPPESFEQDRQAKKRGTGSGLKRVK